MTFEVQILGSNSALSAHGRHPTAQVLRFGSRQFLIDCGEGTQQRMQRYKTKPFKIEKIFISHLHGDHYFGLIGLLTSFHLLQRKTPLTIYAPAPLEQIIQLQLAVANTVLSYPLSFYTTQDKEAEVIFEDEHLCVTSIPLTHRIPCTGFIFKEKKFPRRINADAVKALELSPEMYEQLRAGYDINDLQGQFHYNGTLTTAADAPRSYAYCTDTIYKPDIIPHLKGADLLYHEATFNRECSERAQQTFHSTTEDAAKIALQAEVKTLLIGHFSSKYPELQTLLDESKAIFPATKLALEGQTFEIGPVAAEVEFT